MTRDMVKMYVDNSLNYTMLHAAALMDCNGKGLLLIGSKGAGKTTLALALIYNHAFTEISQDRVYLAQHAEEIIVYGWPTYYCLNQRTVATFPETQHFKKSEFDELTSEELENIKSKSYTIPSSISIHERSAKTITHTVVFLSKSTLYMDKVNLIAENCYSPDDGYTKNWLDLPLKKNEIREKSCSIAKIICNSNRIIELETGDDMVKTSAKLAASISSLK
jgi:GTPase SAR1 family protein